MDNLFLNPIIPFYILLFFLFLNMSFHIQQTTHYLNVSGSEKIEEINIFNLNGNFIKKLEGNNTIINISELLKGMYIIIIKTCNGITQNKFTKE